MQKYTERVIYYIPVFELEARQVVNFYGFQSLVDGIKYQLDSIQG